MNDFINVSFPDMSRVLKAMGKQKNEMEKEIKKAVYETTLFGIAVIAKDCPVDTGRARASIGGKLSEKAGVSLEGESEAIREGLSLSLTEINDMESVIGSNVEYIIFIEYGHKIPQRLAKKQLAYLFASGKLDKQKYKFYSIHKKINSRADAISRVKGKGMFRKNTPKIRKYFYDQLDNAISKIIRDSDNI